MKKQLALLLTIVILILAVPITAFAEHEHNYSVTVMVYNNGTVKKRCSCGATKILGQKVKSVKLKNTKLTYNGKARSVKVVAKNNEGRKISKSFYTVTYNKVKKDRKKAGKYSITVKFKYPYSGKKKLTYYIVGKNQRAYFQSAESNKVIFNFKKKVKTGFIQVQVATDKKFKKNLKEGKVTSKGSKSINGLLPKTKYFYRTRSVVTTKKGTKIYSNWTKVRSFWTEKATAKPTEPSVPTNPEEPTKPEEPTETETGFDENTEQVLIEGKLKIDGNGNYLLFTENRWIDSSTEQYYQRCNPTYDNGSYAEYCGLLYQTYKKLNINSTMSDVEKYMIISRWLGENIQGCNHLNSNTDGWDHDHMTAYNALKNNCSVCGGFSYLTADLCSLCDIPCYHFSGAGHAWCYVKLDGYWYMQDPLPGTSLYSAWDYAINKKKDKTYKPGLTISETYFNASMGNTLYKSIYDNNTPHGNHSNVYDMPTVDYDTFASACRTAANHTFLS